MNTLQTALLSYLLNSLWQVPLLFAAAWLASRLLARRSSPILEHRIWTSALILQVILPACPALPEDALHTALNFIPDLWHSTIAPATAQITITTTTTTHGHSTLHLPAALLTSFAALYTFTLLYCIARLAYSLFKTRQLRQTAQPTTLTGETLGTWQRCSTLFHVADAHIATSDLVYAPSTIGIRSRLILLPSTMPYTLHQQDLNAALAHEFAHMHRRDFALNLLYQLLALPIAWHPALWLTSARIAETREMICDALAARALAGPQDYARSLLRLASLLLRGTPTSTPHAIGIFDANNFERRLMNLTTAPVELRGIRRFATAALCALLGLGACTSALALRAAVPTAVPTPAPQEASPAPPHISGNVIAGTRLTWIQPVYPPEAKAAKLSGIIVLRAVIGKDGKIESLNVVSGPDAFQKSALDAVRQWVYKPYLLNGEPTKVDTTITVNYSLAK
jgi:TonB family protein